MSNECPICNYRGRFKSYRGRAAAYCNGCGALERHRLVWLFWQRKTNLFDGQPKRMLHMAPESCFRHRLPKVAGLDYLTGDLNPGSMKAMRKLNLLKLALPSEQFDAIYCSHVLEHIHDDTKAMSELFRVLKPGGWAVLQVPIKIGEHTFRDPKARSPRARQRAYGQHNHVRMYGDLDYGPKLQSVGFTVDPVLMSAELEDGLVERYSVSRGERIYHCTKPG
jgi:SAM-dependent methyltransferase